MSGDPDPRPAARIIDRDALARARLTEDECAACGLPPGSLHHVIPRGAPHHGDDVPGNLLMLCGSGTTGCHGAWHGNPYTYGRVSILAGRAASVRRDADWVASRIGLHIATKRPDIIAYVFKKLGEQAGRAYLIRRYHVWAE